ncbi:hypothetical protein OTK49_00070 [Vibrio coralliirubri]|uniref:hypothetical protein n=1 Tax=Vibrio coralliirubri TaxID=1516159 RepID=UPI0022840E38|nr:hypothetical protein [Vibrio coralliirubri]MCY9860935.1 hypothetical protein [Vibrio coralliirubri]
MEQELQTEDISVKQTQTISQPTDDKKPEQSKAKGGQNGGAKYRKKVNSTVTEINNELNKILSSGSTIKNINGLEEDMSVLTKKVNEVKKALSGIKKEPEISNPHAAKIYRAMDKLIEIANRHEVNENDQKEIISELRTNLGEANSVINLIKKALDKSEKSEDFNLGS